MRIPRRETSMSVDRSRLRFVAQGVALVVTLATGRVDAQPRPSGRITVYKEPT